MIAVVIRFGRAQMDESAVPAPGQVVIPSAKFPHPAPGGVRTAQRNGRHRPQQVEEVACVAAVAFGSVGGHRHAAEIVRGLHFAQQVEQHRRHPAFSVVLMGLGPGIVVAIRHRALSGIEAQKARASLDGFTDFRILHARVARQHQADGERHARRVHHAVALQSSVRAREAVAPRSHRALALRRLERESPQAGHHGLVSGGRDVFRQQRYHVSVVPGLHPAPLELRRPFRLPLHQRQVGRVATGEQGEGVEGARDGIQMGRVVRFGGACRERRESALQNAGRLRAVVRRGRGERTHHRQLHHDLLCFAGAPARQGQLAAGLFGLRGSDGPAELRPRIEGKVLPAHAEQHVADREHAVRRRPLVHGGEDDLPCVGGHEPVAVHPAAGAGRAEVPVLFRLLRDGVAPGEIGDRRQFASTGRVRDQAEA